MRRRPLILTAIGLAALVIVYAVYWFMLARIVAQDIAGWTGFYRSQGYAVSYEVPPLSGFPFAVTARFIHPDVAAPDGRWRWQGAEVRLRIQPWAPYELQFTGLGSQKLSIAGTQAREIAIAADLLGLDVHLKDGLEADRFGFTLTHGAIDDSPADISNVHRSHLKEAINDLVAGKDISVKESRSVGCSIKRKG